MRANEQVREMIQLHKETMTDFQLEFLKTATKFVASLSSPIERELYGSKLAHEIGISNDAFQAEVERQRKINYNAIKVEFIYGR